MLTTGIGAGLLLLVATSWAATRVVVTTEAQPEHQDADGQDHDDEADDPHHPLPA